MDPVSHAALGRTLIAAFAAGRQRARPPRAWVAAAVLGALSPDLDAVLMPFGWDQYLRVHEIGTHTLAGTLACAVLTAAAVRVFAREGRYSSLLLPAWLGAGSHVLLDLLSSARLRPGWPLVDTVVSLPVVAMADPWLFALCVAGPVWIWIAERPRDADFGGHARDADFADHKRDADLAGRSRDADFADRLNRLRDADFGGHVRDADFADHPQDADYADLSGRPRGADHADDSDRSRDAALAGPANQPTERSSRSSFDGLGAPRARPAGQPPPKLRRPAGALAKAGAERGLRDPRERRRKGVRGTKSPGLERRAAFAILAVMAAFLVGKSALGVLAFGNYRVARDASPATVGARVIEARWAALNTWHVFDRAGSRLRAWRTGAGRPAQEVFGWTIDPDMPLVNRSRSFSTVRNFLRAHELGFAVTIPRPGGGTWILWSDIRFCWDPASSGAPQVEPIVRSASANELIACALWFGGEFDARGRPVQEIVRLGRFTQARSNGE
jgi:membrane-bound metal-dependent hydrolase YbcI (DUF457 family)